jgi:hypothetical protein
LEPLEPFEPGNFRLLNFEPETLNKNTKGKRAKYKGLRNILGKTKANVEEAEVGEVPEPERRAQVLRFVEPGTAADHAQAALVIVDKGNSNTADRLSPTKSAQDRPLLLSAM